MQKKNMEKMEAIPATFMNDPVFRRLGEVARYGALNEEERAAYKHSLKVYRDNYAIAETERAEGRAEGVAEGMAEGMAKGMAKGIAVGEMNRTRQIAKTDNSMGMSVNHIIRLTNLSRKEIEEL